MTCILPLFVKDIRLDSIQYHVPGTILNYNLFGTFLAMISTVALSVLLFAPLSFKRKAVTATILVLCAYALVRTTSRGAFVALILSVVLLWLLRLSLNRSRRALHALALTVIVVFGIILGGAILREPETLSAGHPIRAFVSRFQPEHVQRGFGLRAADFGSCAGSGFGVHRLWYRTIERSGNSSLPPRDLTHLRRYGIFGLAVYVAVLGASALTCLRLLRSKRIVTGGYARVLLAGTLGKPCIFVVTSAIYQVFDQLQLAAIFWWFVGIAFAYSGFTSRQQRQQVAARPSRHSGLNSYSWKRLLPQWQRHYAHLTSVHACHDTRILYKECGTLAKAGDEVVLIVPHDLDEVVDGVRIGQFPGPGTGGAHDPYSMARLPGSAGRGRRFVSLS